MHRPRDIRLYILALILMVPLNAQARRHHRHRRVHKKTMISIFCNVDNANYIIDEGKQTKEMRGVVTSAPLEVQPGSHTIKVYKKGYLPYTDVFEASKGKTTEVDATLTLYFGWITLVSSPSGAQVIVDGKKKGVTPVSLELPRGEHTIILSTKGYMATQKKVKVIPGKTRELSMTLKPIPKVAVVTKKRWYKKAWVWTVIGAAVAGGVTAAVLLSRGGSNAPPTPDAQTLLSW